ncbi:putative sterigmatocystin 8-O-methyltransferase precursor [Periconia macrospinosa]|uniref:Putative sterigmatocystin 8-O-methyltransferase n=1 Tax=Periconia macrospinosa TaxID=97972 RepID=A0A2V1E9G9_9PLEO|nr:putative sterigmatocystin 8-O-methyltransferase precursor [Periconia macrospinosa]
MSTTTTAAADLTKNLLDFTASLPAEIGNEEREALLAACEKTRSALENPLEATVRFMFGPFQSVALCLGVNMKLLDLGLAAHGPITAEQLAAGSNADALLVVRVMRILVTMGIFEEVAHHTYVATPLAGIWASGSPLRESIIHIASQIPPITMLPEYFEEKGYNNPTDAENGPFQFTYQSKMHFFEWLSQRPKVQSAFNATMEIARNGRGQEWFEFYPVAEKLTLADRDSTAILLVDIGGNVGYDLINFQRRFPELPGRLVFEDLPTIISSVDTLPEGVEAVGHDFFQPQPSTIRNAKAYYLRNILHDWPDKQSKQILENIRPLMGKDTVLLINENALPDDNVGFYPAALDLIMMGVFASLDRTASQFEQLLDSAGFKLVATWRPKDYGPGSGTLFEAALKD